MPKFASEVAAMGCELRNRSSRGAIASLYQFKYRRMPRATRCLSFVHKCFRNFIMVDLGRQQAHACVVAARWYPLAAVRADASRQLDGGPRDRYVDGRSSVAFSANGTSKTTTMEKRNAKARPADPHGPVRLRSVGC